MTYSAFPPDLRFPFKSVRTGDPFSGRFASRCIGPASDLPVICPMKEECVYPELIPPKSWAPKDKLTWGWVSCKHLIEEEEVYANIIATPDGKGFIVGTRPRGKYNSQQTLPLNELNEKLVVYWGEQYLLQLATQPAVRTLMAAHGVPETAGFALPELTMVPSCGVNENGQYIFGQTSPDGEQIIISSWQLVDLEETCGTLRHEFAHRTVTKCRLREANPHGENFKRVLQTTAPNTWERDLKGHITPLIRAAIERIHGEGS